MDLITAYVDASRPPYPHEDFRTFRKARLAALELAFGVQLSEERLPDVHSKCIWMLFESTVSSLLATYQDGLLEGGLLYQAIKKRDTPQLNIQGIQTDLYKLLEAYRARHFDLLVSLFRCLWGPLEGTVTTADLLKAGFDDSKEPQIQNYYDHM